MSDEQRCPGCGEVLYRVVSPDGVSRDITFGQLNEALWAMTRDLRSLINRWQARAAGHDVICEGFRQCADDLAKLLDGEEP